MKTIDNIIFRIDRKKQVAVDLTILILVSLACLAPFLGKALHMDDPMYVWAARQIQTNPLDFYGFTINWSTQEIPMFEIMKNPPLASYYIALVASLFGWAERTLHAAFLLPALAAVIGTYYLSREFCGTPLLAALAGILTPVFLLSSTTVMCDIMMLSFWVWAAFMWMRGMKNDSAGSLLCAAFLITLSSLTKYYGMSLIPLLFTYSLIKKRTLGRWTLYLLIPVLVLSAYQWLTYTLYGRGLLMDASSYALAHQTIDSETMFAKSMTGLFFTGGCFISVLFFSYVLWQRQTLAIIAVAAAPVVFYYILQIVPNGLQYDYDKSLNWLFILQCYLFSIAGMGVLLLALSDLWRGKDADSFLLFAWIAGTLLFSCFLNWTVSGRSVLPMLPAIGILLARRIEHRRALHDMMTARYILLPLTLSLVVSISVVRADYLWADTVRQEAVEISTLYKNDFSTLWFQGHWGFQYYMEMHGGKALDRKNSLIARGDRVVTPSNNTNVIPLPEDLFELIHVDRITPCSWLSTSNRLTGAGFYSSLYGPLPFVIDRVPSQEYSVFLAK